jgi:hypothetical protein
MSPGGSPARDPVRPRLTALGASVLLLVAAAGPYDIALHPTPTAPGARGRALLVAADSPFGIGVTADGRARYDIRISASRLPRPDSLGHFGGYVAWATTPDLTQWIRLGVVRNGTSTVGPVELNKFLLVVTAEPASAAVTHSGPTILHGTSPSGWLQSFITHPLFRGIAQ